MSKTDNVKGYNDNKKINWLVSIYPTLSKKAYKTRVCVI